MITAAINFFINTRIGQSLLLALCITAAVAITYNVVEQKGYDRCKGEQSDDINKANVDTIEGQNKRDQTSSEVSQDTRAKNQEAVANIDLNDGKAKETVDNAYSKPPTTAPIAYGSCVHPLDDSVQATIDAGYRQANPATR